jgi:hypothetical protein
MPQFLFVFLEIGSQKNSLGRENFGEEEYDPLTPLPP